MTEQEYCDLSDLQICRAILRMTTTLNCFENPNKTRRRGIVANVQLMIEDLEPKISEAMDKDVA